MPDNENVLIAGYVWYGNSKGFRELAGGATIKEDMISHSVSVGYGVCGAPILHLKEGVMEVVGMHIFCRQRQGAVERGGIKLSENMFCYLKRWCILEE